jgi:hypothetical protein
MNCCGHNLCGVVPTYTYYKNMRDKQPRNQVEHVMVVLFEEQIKKACMQKSQCSGEESDRTTWALPKGNDLFQRERRASWPPKGVAWS